MRLLEVQLCLNACVKPSELLRSIHSMTLQLLFLYSYEDNDQEVIPLWAPNQLVRIHNTPSEWPVEAERIRR